jgi:ubiquinone/menaquinone biosynthesis C-methylase UbiE
MQSYARTSAAAAGLGPQQLQLVDGVAEAMPFPSESFDAVVMTLVGEGEWIPKFCCPAVLKYI